MHALFFFPFLLFPAALAASDLLSADHSRQDNIRSCYTADPWIGRKKAEHILQQRFGETLKAGGLSQNQKRAFELYVSDKTRTWTMLLLRKHGKGMQACMFAAGQSWTNADQGQKI